MTLQFISLSDYGRETLAKELMADDAGTSYVSKEKLSERIMSTEKVDGFAVVFFEEGKEQVTRGFVLDTDDKKVITDMYTFKQGRGHFLFNWIAGHYLGLGWEKKFAYDDNNAKMQEFFEKAADHPKTAE